MIRNNMPESFFEWLDKCPVQWWLLGQNKEGLEYSFTVPEEDDKEKDEQ